MKQEGKIGPLQKQVLDCIKAHPAGINNRQIAEELKIAINVITPRVNELVKKYLVREGIKSKDLRTNKLTIFWVAEKL